MLSVQLRSNGVSIDSTLGCVLVMIQIWLSTPRIRFAKTETFVCDRLKRTSIAIDRLIGAMTSSMAMRILSPPGNCDVAMHGGPKTHSLPACALPATTHDDLRCATRYLCTTFGVAQYAETSKRGGLSSCGTHPAFTMSRPWRPNEHTLISWRLSEITNYNDQLFLNVVGSQGCKRA